MEWEQIIGRIDQDAIHGDLRKLLTFKFTFWQLLAGLSVEHVICVLVAYEQQWQVRSKYEILQLRVCGHKTTEDWFPVGIYSQANFRIIQ